MTIPCSANETHPKNLGQTEGTLSKLAFLAGLPRSVRKRIEAAHRAGWKGTGVAIPRDTRPDGSDRSGEFPDWAFRFLEAAFAVEDEVESELARTGTAPSDPRMNVVHELRRRRNGWFDILGENEIAPRNPTQPATPPEAP